jgi:hypothetical protein
MYSFAGEPLQNMNADETIAAEYNDGSIVICHFILLPCQGLVVDSFAIEMGSLHWEYE